jgi:hypothetical protein
VLAVDGLRPALEVLRIRADTSAAGNDGSFDPQQAAVLLEQATRQARRTFGPGSPPLWTFRAVLALVAFGGFWLSVRSHQNPDSAPSGWSLPVAFVLVVIDIAWSAVMLQRAGAGVSGPAQRRKRAWLGASEMASSFGPL